MKSKKQSSKCDQLHILSRLTWTLRSRSSGTLRSTWLIWKTIIVEDSTKRSPRSKRKSWETTCANWSPRVSMRISSRCVSISSIKKKSSLSSKTRQIHSAQPTRINNSSLSESRSSHSTTELCLSTCSFCAWRRPTSTMEKLIQKMSSICWWQPKPPKKKPKQLKAPLKKTRVSICLARKEVKIRIILKAVAALTTQRETSNSRKSEDLDIDIDDVD